MAHTASNSNHSPVSCLNLQALESFPPISFYFSSYPLPIEPVGHLGQSENQNQQYVPTPSNFPGQDFLDLCLHLLRTSTVILEHRRTYVCSRTHGNRFSFFFLFQFVVSFSFLQKMQTKEKQGFQLKVHLFFNMKTLIELVGSPMQWSAKSFGNWQNDIWRLRSWGWFEETSLHESWAKGNGCGRRERTLGEEYRRRKEKNVIGEEENGTLLFLPSTSFPSFLWTDDSSPLRGELSSLLKPWCILLWLHFRWTSPLHIFIIYFVSHGIINMLLSLRNEGWLWGAGPVFSSHMWHISQWRSQSLQNIPQCSTSGSPLSLVLFLPLLPPENESSHAIAVGDWLIWTLIEWMLFRIFFWWPAKVTPILRRSLGGENTKEGTLMLQQLFRDQNSS